MTSKKQIDRYLQKRGLIEELDWQEINYEKLKKFLINNYSLITFNGEQHGYIKFVRDNGHNRCIQFCPDRINVETLMNEIRLEKNGRRRQ